MLEKIDLANRIDKDRYKGIIDELRFKAAEVQRKALKLGIPVIVVFEGWDAAGKGTLINKLILALDPRGFAVYPTNPPTRDEKLRPFVWRFWINTPARGRIAVFDRSWYGRVLVERVDKLVSKKEWSRAYSEICSFERQLCDEGTVIIKFFLHIDKKEQEKRFDKLQSNPKTAWKVTKEDWKHNRQYDKYLVAIEDMLAATDSEFAPWTIIEAHDRRFATVKIFTTFIETIENRVEALAVKQAARPGRKRSLTSILDQVDLSRSLTKEEYSSALSAGQKRMLEIEHEIFLQRIPLIIVYEGQDAAGKGGNIRRLVQGMDPRGFEVIPIAAPNDIEKSHHYLWRFWNKIPKAGHIAIFDRSWYGRVLVERIEGFCRPLDWERAFREINEMEKQFVDFGGVLIKFWLQIDKDEQLRRFQARENTQHKRWKITDEDWRNREKWDLYKKAIDEMLLRTSTSYAPWTIVESNNKWFARIKVIRTVIGEVEEVLK